MQGTSKNSIHVSTFSPLLKFPREKKRRISSRRRNKIRTQRRQRTKPEKSASRRATRDSAINVEISIGAAFRDLGFPSQRRVVLGESFPFSLSSLVLSGGSRSRAAAPLASEIGLAGGRGWERRGFQRPRVCIHPAPRREGTRLTSRVVPSTRVKCAERR